VRNALNASKRSMNATNAANASPAALLPHGRPPGHHGRPIGAASGSHIRAALNLRVARRPSAAARPPDRAARFQGVAAHFFA
jgi:hypothetical protein